MANGSAREIGNQGQWNVQPYVHPPHSIGTHRLRPWLSPQVDPGQQSESIAHGSQQGAQAGWTGAVVPASVVPASAAPEVPASGPGPTPASTPPVGLVWQVTVHFEGLKVQPYEHSPQVDSKAVGTQ